MQNIVASLQGNTYQGAKNSTSAISLSAKLFLKLLSPNSRTSLARQMANRAFKTTMNLYMMLTISCTTFQLHRLPNRRTPILCSWFSFELYTNL